MCAAAVAVFKWICVTVSFHFHIFSPRHCVSDALFLLFLISLFLSLFHSLNNEPKRKGKLLRHQQHHEIPLKIEVVTSVTNFLFSQKSHFLPLYSSTEKTLKILGKTKTYTAKTEGSDAGGKAVVLFFIIVSSFNSNDLMHSHDLNIMTPTAWMALMLGFRLDLVMWSELGIRSVYSTKSYHQQQHKKTNSVVHHLWEEKDRSIKKSTKGKWDVKKSGRTKPATRRASLIS